VGALGGVGGTAQGGGVALISQLYGGSLSASITSSVITGDSAHGGTGGFGADGGDGGDALGGGLYVDPASIVSLQLAAITNNAADGGLGGSAISGGTVGDNGQGIGGGVYLAGTGSTKKNTTISGNSASTSGNNVYGTFS
jgi:hypothetical protein